MSMSAPHFFQILMPGAVFAPLAAVAIFGSTAFTEMLASQAASNTWVYLASQPFFTCALIFGGLAMVSAFGQGGVKGLCAFLAVSAGGIGGMALAQYAVPAIASAAGSVLSAQTMEIVLISTYSATLLLSSIFNALLGPLPAVGRVRNDFPFEMGDL